MFNKSGLIKNLFWFIYSAIISKQTREKGAEIELSLP
jgi:hypothetical protein